MNTALLTVDSLNIDYAVAEWLLSKRLAGSKRNVTTTSEETGEQITEVVNRTEEEYASIMQSFRAYLAQGHMDLLSNPVDITRVAALWASQRNERGHKRRPHQPMVSANTFALRVAAVSSWYSFVQDRYKLDFPNPMKDVKRPKVQPYAAALPLDPEIVQQGLDEINRSTLVGMRDYALLTVALATGKRASELVGMRRKDIKIAGKKGSEIITLSFLGKGEKADRKKLDDLQSSILLDYLIAQYGERFSTMPEETPVWVSYSKRNAGQAIDAKTLSNICKKHFGTSKVHTTRHTFSIGMLRSGADITQLAKELNHTDIRTTMAYTNELTKEENPFSQKLSERFGFKPRTKNEV